MMNKEMAMVNGMNIDVTTVMDKTVTYRPLPKESEILIQRSNELLDEYFSFSQDDGLHEMFDLDGEFWKAKGWLIAAMEKIPGYNGNYQIVLKDQDMNRHLDWQGMLNFVSYVRKRRETTLYYTYKGKVMSDEERSNEIGHLKNLRRKAWRNDLYELYNKINEKVDSLISIMPSYDEKYDFFYEVVKETINYLYGKRSEINDLERILCDAVIADKANCIAAKHSIKFKAVIGQAFTKMIGKAANICGIKNHTDFQNISFYDQDGNYHERQKDFGWNYQYAQFADSCSPITLKATAVISVNPLDYWTMSFGKDWASCHTIDKRNKRGVMSDHYEGMYCGGTESYMLDSSSVIFYFLPQNFDGDRPELEDKVKRCVFYLGEDKLIQSRVYPDGRDNPNEEEAESLAKDIRVLMQGIVSKMFDAPNYWSIKKGTSACSEVTYSYGAHYRDYLHYNDCNVSYMKRIDGYRNDNPIRIGMESICPSCGKKHTTNDNIFCEDCGRGGFIRCWECGEEIDNIDDAHEIDGHWYCENCITFCEDCEEPIPTDEAYTVYYLNEWDRGCTREVCSYCRNNNYTWVDSECEYYDNDDIIETEEGNYYLRTSDEYGECNECCDCHDFDALHYVEDRDEYLCDDCYEQYKSEMELDLDEEDE